MRTYAIRLLLIIPLLLGAGCGHRESATALVDKMQESLPVRQQQERDAVEQMLTQYLAALRQQQVLNWQLAVERTRGQVHQRIAEKRRSLRADVDNRFMQVVDPDLKRLQARLSETTARAAQGDAVASRELIECKAAMATALAVVYRYAGDAMDKVEKDIAAIEEQQMRALDDKAKELPSDLANFDPKDVAKKIMETQKADEHLAAMNEGFERLDAYINAPSAISSTLKGLIPDNPLFKGLGDIIQTRSQTLIAQVEAAAGAQVGAWMGKLDDKLGRELKVTTSSVSGSH